MWSQRLIFFCYCARHVQVFFSNSFATEGYRCSGFVVSPTIRLLKELGGHGQALWRTVRAASGFGSSGMTRVRPKNMSINHLRTPTCQNFHWQSSTAGWFLGAAEHRTQTEVVFKGQNSQWYKGTLLKLCLKADDPRFTIQLGDFPLIVGLSIPTKGESPTGIVLTSCLVFSLFRFFHTLIKKKKEFEPSH